MNVIKNTQVNNDSTLEKLLEMTLPDIAEEVLEDVEFKRIVYEFITDKMLSQIELEKLKHWVDDDAMLSLCGLRNLVRQEKINSLEGVVHFLMRKKKMARHKLSTKEKSRNGVYSSQYYLAKCLCQVLFKRLEKKAQLFFTAIQIKANQRAVGHLFQVHKSIKEISKDEMDEVVGGMKGVREPVFAQYHFCHCIAKVNDCG